MYKLDISIDQLGKELISEIKDKAQRAFTKTAIKASFHAQSLAASKLDDSREIWKRGFKVIYKTNGEFVMQMDGELANLIEEGYNPGAFNKMIMNGQRAKHNKAQGKNYVDVPISSKKMPSSVTARSGDDLLKEFTVKKYTISDFQNKKIREDEPRLTRAIKTFENGKKSQILESKKFKSGSSSFIKFVRVTDTSTFPKKGFTGAQIFREVERMLDSFYETALRNQF